MARAEDVRGELVALARELEAASFMEQAPSVGEFPSRRSSRARSRRVPGGDIGSIFSVHVSGAAVRSRRPERAAAQARAGRSRRSRGVCG